MTKRGRLSPPRLCVWGWHRSSTIGYHIKSRNGTQTRKNLRMAKTEPLAPIRKPAPKKKSNTVCEI